MLLSVKFINPFGYFLSKLVFLRIREMFYIKKAERKMLVTGMKSFDSTRFS